MATQHPQLIRLKLRKRWEVAHIRALSASTSTHSAHEKAPGQKEQHFLRDSCMAMTQRQDCGVPMLQPGRRALHSSQK